MAFWSSETIRQKLRSLVDPPNEDRIQNGSYELSLGPEVFSSDSSTKKNLSPGEQVVIPPGQFGLLLTEEKVTIPNNAIGLISIKTGMKFRGLVNVSGFHVDPGFNGCLKFSVYNAGSQNVVLSRGEPLFLIWFCDLDHATDDIYKGSRQNQEDITTEDVMRIQGEIASPASLKKQIDELRSEHDKKIAEVESNVSVWRSITIGIITIIIGLLASALFFSLRTSEPQSSPTKLSTGGLGKSSEERNGSKSSERKLEENSTKTGSGDLATKENGETSKPNESKTDKKASKSEKPNDAKKIN